MTHNPEQLTPDTEEEWRVVPYSDEMVEIVADKEVHIAFCAKSYAGRQYAAQIVADHKAAKSQALLVEALRESKSLLESSNELARVIAEPKVLGLIDAALKAAGVEG